MSSISEADKQAHQSETKMPVIQTIMFTFGRVLLRKIT